MGKNPSNIAEGSGPHPKPVGQRLAGVFPRVSEEETNSVNTSVHAPTSAKMADSQGIEHGEAAGNHLRLDPEKNDGPKDQDDGGTPPRGPPKTPKRNKGSSPQVSNVRADPKAC